MSSAAYTHEKRAIARNGYRRVEMMRDAARTAMDHGTLLTPDMTQAIEILTKTTDRNNQIVALEEIAENIRADHFRKLTSIAKEDFGAFCEVVNPDEPPESPWHIWLTDKLQEIERNPKMNKFVLNCPPGHAKPLEIATPVMMGDGSYKPLGAIKVGDFVMTHVGRARAVTAIHKQGVLPLVRVTSAYGRQVLAAKDHPFMIERDGVQVYVNAADLLPGQKLVVEGGGGVLAVGKKTRNHRAEFLGYLFAGSAMTYQKSKTDKVTPDCRLSSYSTARTKAIVQCVETLGGSAGVYPAGEGASKTYIIRLGLPFYKAITGNTDLIEHWYTKDPRTRRVPPEVFTYDASDLAQFLSAVLTLRGETKRAKVGRTVHLTMKTLEGLRDMQRLLAKADVQARLQLPDPDFGGTVSLHIDDAGVKTLLKFGVKLGDHFPEAFERARPLGEGFQPMDPYLDPVRSVEGAGKGECRCLSVDEDHTFTADGLVVHNSTYASRLFVAWRLGRDPNQRIIGGGHGQTFVENEFSKKIRDLIGSPEYATVFPEVRVAHDSRAAGQWSIAGKKGQYIAKGVGQGVHGFRATFICVDDPYAKIEEAQSPTIRKKIETWFDGDLASRALPSCKIFLIMTRFHGEDLTHHLEMMNPQLPEHLRWEIVSVPAICYDVSTDILDRQLGDVLWSFYGHDYFVGKRVEFGFVNFALTYQQISSAATPGNIAAKFQYFKQLPYMTEDALKDCLLDSAGRPIPNKAKYIKRTVVSVDCAAKTTERADYTVVQVWMEGRDGNHYLVHQERKKVEFNEMIALIEAPAIRFGADVILVEDKGQGTAYLQARGQSDFQKRLAPAPLVPINPGVQGKAFRFDAVSPIIDAGEVYVPENAIWLDAFMVEAGQFPDSAHDDQIDALSQYLAYARENNSRYGTRKLVRG